jgi:tetratricopeptide (TPR) repeat protein
MNPAPAQHRLRRLAGYLAEDPTNPALLADTFDEALACGALHEAGEYAATAAEQWGPSPAWRLRRARLCIALRHLEEAARLLDELQGCEGIPPQVLLHDRAYVRLLQGQLAECKTMLAPHTSVFSGMPAAGADMTQRAALQVLWLRVLHRMNSLREAWGWLQKEQVDGAVSSAAQGVASLIALDLVDFPSARRLADAALGADDRQPEALVARGCVALAMRRTDEAKGLLERALESGVKDGRIWSGLGFASLQEMDLPRAVARLEEALRFIPEHVGTWHALGWARLLQRDLPGARSAFEQALLLDRNFAETHGAVALVLVLQRQVEAARKYLATAHRLDRANVSGRYASAVLAGEAEGILQVQQLAKRLLDRPGFFGGKLSDAVHPQAEHDAPVL